MFNTTPNKANNRELASATQMLKGKSYFRIAQLSAPDFNQTRSYHASWVRTKRQIPDARFSKRNSSLLSLHFDAIGYKIQIDESIMGISNWHRHGFRRGTRQGSDFEGSPGHVNRSSEIRFCKSDIFGALANQHQQIEKTGYGKGAFSVCDGVLWYRRAHR